MKAARKKSGAPQAKKRARVPLSAKTRLAKPGAEFEKLVAVQKRLRAPKGCPWDREQTHETLRTYLIEEVYEVLDALESGDDAKFVEELGDLLLQITFHSQIAAEQGRFTVADVVRAIHDKMVRRHPHVFGKTRVKDSAEVLKNWEKIKARERQESESGNGSAAKNDADSSVLEGVPRSLPGLLEALQLTKRAARVGFDWRETGGIFDKINEESAELRRAIETKNSLHVEEELGDLLFAAVNLARFVRVDPEIALKKANGKFARRFRAMEKIAAGNQQTLAEVGRGELEELWNAVKRNEATSKQTPVSEA